MLRALRIRNFAIVDSLDIAFDSGLTVFTGETGAGKTILVEAIRFLLGGKTGTEMIRTGADSIVVEGDFDGVILRREMSAQGRSRCFKDDAQITISELATFGESLADHCGQHQHQVLLDPGRHLEWLDQCAGISELTTRVKLHWFNWSTLSHALKELAAKIERRTSEEELLRFQIQEIRSANLEPDEEDRLKSEATILKHARRLAEAADMALRLLSEDNESAPSIQSVLSRVRRDAGSTSEIDARWDGIVAPLSAAVDSVQDAVHALTHYRDHLAFDPQRADEIESRLSLIFRLKKKYGDSCTAILAHLQSLEADASSDLALDNELKRLSADRERSIDALVAHAADLSIKRHAAAKTLAAAVNTVIARLGMAKASVNVELTPHGDGGLAIGNSHIHEHGAEQVRFLFEANPAEGYKPLHKSASGGELSRLLLAFKSAISRYGKIADAAPQAPLFIFDEIDSGIGGQTAHAVAHEIKSLAKNGQVFLITHLQQLATVADTHYRITKKTKSNRARVLVERLDGNARIRELARMIAGDDVTERTLDFAAELAGTKSHKKL